MHGDDEVGHLKTYQHIYLLAYQPISIGDNETHHLNDDDNSGDGVDDAGEGDGGGDASPSAMFISLGSKLLSLRRKAKFLRVQSSAH